MTHEQFKQLCGYAKAKKNAFKPTIKVTSRRSAKHTSVGKVFKNSQLVHGVHLETIFNHPAWKV